MSDFSSLDPIQINLGEGRVLVSVFRDHDKYGLLLEDTGEPHVVGSVADNNTGPHTPKHGEVYIRCWNLESAKALLASVTDLVFSIENKR